MPLTIHQKLSPTTIVLPLPGYPVPLPGYPGTNYNCSATTRVLGYPQVCVPGPGRAVTADSFSLEL
eukprot:1959049-Rhodomonas_salina.1